MEEIQKDRIQKSICDTYSICPEYLWKEYPDYAVFRHPLSHKWFAICMNVAGVKLGLNTPNSMSVLNVKCNENLIDSLLHEEGFLRAYHMNKRLWVSILLCDKVSDSYIMKLVDSSYEAVSLKRKSK